MMTFDFPVGYHELHPTKIVDYQLNRWHSLGYSRLEDMRAAAAEIDGLEDWKEALLRQADRALAEGRLLNGTFYIRAAEFFTRVDDPDKRALYDRFQTLFYDELTAGEPLERHRVPYADGFLPALRLPARGGAARDTLVIHGGFDSFIEEFYSLATSFAGRGYEVILFEGPGQGGALKKAGLPLDYRWERPAAAVLDYFDRDGVSWLGISMGGWMCFRAAAFESRIRRVIALSIAYDYMEIPPAPVAAFARWLMGRRRLMNFLSEVKMKLVPQERWGIENLMYITRTETPLDASEEMLKFNAENQQPAQVTQDVLILTGEEDHFIPVKMHHLQVAALRNARSMTDRIFTRADHAHNHCQVGNMGLALETMATWLEEIQEADRPVPTPTRSS